jgi:hypothetical protein
MPTCEIRFLWILKKTKSPSAGISPFGNWFAERIHTCRTMWHFFVIHLFVDGSYKPTTIETAAARRTITITSAIMRIYFVIYLRIIRQSEVYSAKPEK